MWDALSEILRRRTQDILMGHRCDTVDKGRSSDHTEKTVDTLYDILSTIFTPLFLHTFHEESYTHTLQDKDIHYFLLLLISDSLDIPVFEL